MPCWEKRKIQLNFATANRELLLQALEAQGFQFFWGEDWKHNRDAKLTREQALTADVLYAYNHDPSIYTRDAGATAIFEGGKLEIRANNEAMATAHASKLQQGYATAAVRYAAKRFGFVVGENKAQANRMTLQRRF